MNQAKDILVPRRKKQRYSFTLDRCDAQLLDMAAGMLAEQDDKTSYRRSAEFWARAIARRAAVAVAQAILRGDNFRRKIEVELRDATDAEWNEYYYKKMWFKKKKRERILDFRQGYVERN